MTVREKSSLNRALGQHHDVSALWAISHVVGELQVQAVGYEGRMVTVFIPSSVGQSEPRSVNLIDSAPASAWKASRSLMAAVRAGYVHVTLDKPQPKKD